MNNLDEKILEIFKHLLNSGASCLNKVDYISNVLEYKIDGVEINLCIYSTSSDQEVKPNSHTTVNDLVVLPGIPFCGLIACNNVNNRDVRYSISINGKSYRVPKLGRVDQAQALDRLDSILKTYEAEQVDSILSKFLA